jgi:hypothetical protein
MINICIIKHQTCCVVCTIEYQTCCVVCTIEYQTCGVVCTIDYQTCGVVCTIEYQTCDALPFCGFYRFIDERYIILLHTHVDILNLISLKNVT